MMARARRIAPWLAGGVLVAGIAISLLLPMYTCEWGHLQEIRATGARDAELICIQSDLGYRPQSWLPTKIAVASGAAVLAVAILLIRRNHFFAALALVMLFAAITAAWFLPDGFRPPVRGEVGVPHVVDRHEVRAALVATGVVVALGLAVADVFRTRRGPPSAVA